MLRCSSVFMLLWFYCFLFLSLPPTHSIHCYIIFTTRFWYILYQFQLDPFLSYLYFIAFSSLLKPLNVPHITPNPYIARSYPRNPKFTRTAPGSSSTPVTPSSSGKVKSRSRSKSPFRSFRWRSAKKLIAGSHHSDDEGILGVWMDWNHYVDWKNSYLFVDVLNF